MSVSDEHIKDLLGDDLSPDEESITEGEGEVADNPAPESEAEQPKATPEPDKEEPSPENKPDAQEVEPDPQKPPKGFVPHQALHEERMRRQERDREVRELQEKFQSLASLKDELEEMRRESQQRTKKEDFESKFNEDPIEALRLQQEEIRNKIAEYEGKIEQDQHLTEEQRQQQQQFAELQKQVREMTLEFEEQNPDYSQAFTHYLQSRTSELQAIGVTDPVEIQQALDQELVALSYNAMQRKTNPAEWVYNLAKAKGYTKPAENAPQPEPDPQKGDDMQKAMDRLQKGAEAAESLSGGAGPDSGGLSLADIENMSDEEFDKLWAEMDKDAR